MRVLIIDDDKDLVALLKDQLSKFFIVDVVAGGDTGIYLSQVNFYDVIVVDISLPDIDGIEVCSIIRASGISVPILMLTGQLSIDYKVRSFDCGADDYLTKPFEFAELFMRLKALIRRFHNLPKQTTFYYKDLILDSSKRQLVMGSAKTPLHLTRKEFDLLEYFLANPSKTLTQEQLTQKVWFEYEKNSANSLEVHIYCLNKKLGRKYIKAVYGVGYKLD